MNPESSSPMKAKHQRSSSFPSRIRRGGGLAATKRASFNFEDHRRAALRQQNDYHTIQQRSSLQYHPRQQEMLHRALRQNYPTVPHVSPSQRAHAMDTSGDDAGKRQDSKPNFGFGSLLEAAQISKRRSESPPSSPAAQQQQQAQNLQSPKLLSGEKQPSPTSMDGKPKRSTPTTTEEKQLVIAATATEKPARSPASSRSRTPPTSPHTPPTMQRALTAPTPRRRKRSRDSDNDDARSDDSIEGGTKCMKTNVMSFPKTTHHVYPPERCSRACLSCFRSKKKCDSQRPCERCNRMEQKCVERPVEMSREVKYFGKCTHCMKYLRKTDSNVHRCTLNRKPSPFWKLGKNRNQLRVNEKHENCTCEKPNHACVLSLEQAKAQDSPLALTGEVVSSSYSSDAPTISSYKERTNSNSPTNQKPHRRNPSFEMNSPSNNLSSITDSPDQQQPSSARRNQPPPIVIPSPMAAKDARLMYMPQPPHTPSPPNQRQHPQQLQRQQQQHNNNRHPIKQQQYQPHHHHPQQQLKFAPSLETVEMPPQMRRIPNRRFLNRGAMRRKDSPETNHVKEQMWTENSRKDSPTEALSQRTASLSIRDPAEEDEFSSAWASFERNVGGRDKLASLYDADTAFITKIIDDLKFPPIIQAQVSAKFNQLRQRYGNVGTPRSSTEFNDTIRHLQNMMVQTPHSLGQWPAPTNPMFSMYPMNHAM